MKARTGSPSRAAATAPRRGALRFSESITSIISRDLQTGPRRLPAKCLLHPSLLPCHTATDLFISLRAVAIVSHCLPASCPCPPVPSCCLSDLSAPQICSSCRWHPSVQWPQQVQTEVPTPMHSRINSSLYKLLASSSCHITYPPALRRRRCAFRIHQALPGQCMCSCHELSLNPWPFPSC